MKYLGSIFSALAALALGVSLLVACEEDPKPDDPPDPPAPVVDPILEVSVPGAYGVPGGDVIYDMGGWQQYGRLVYPGGQGIRFLNRQDVRAANIIGIPRKDFKAGDSYRILYRVVEHGYTRVSEYFDVEVLDYKDQTLWLKNSAEIYFVIWLK